MTGKTAASRQEGEGAAGKSKQGADETAGGAVAVSAEKKIPEAKEPRGKTQKGRRRREDKKGGVREIRRVTMALRFFLSKKGQAPDGDRLCQTPVLPGTVPACTQTLAGSATLSDSGVTGVVTIDASDVRSLTLTLRQKLGQETVISVRNGELVFDRSRAGVPIAGAEQDADSLAGIRRMPVDTAHLALTIVMDRYSVEIFSAGRALSSTIYPDSDADGIVLTVDAAACTYSRAALAE